MPHRWPDDDETVEAWTATLAAARPWCPASTGIVAVAPHPDDEAILFGGLIAGAAARQVPVRVLAVTDGGAAYPHDVDAARLAALRRREQTNAVAHLGLAPSAVTRLGIPDGEVAGHEAALVDAITAAIGPDVDLVVAPWEHDHHTDHEACGRATRRAVARCGRPVTAVFGLFWALLRSDPPPDLLLVGLELTQCVLEAKRRAIDSHASQVTDLVRTPPMLDPAELAVTRWHLEHYILGAS